MSYDDCSASLWDKIKFYILMKLALNLWDYVIIHEDYWKKIYGISFTSKRDFIKRVKYDMAEADDLEVESSKNK